jgi:signal transduction histidine kinase/DNA-binding response OmpR family regulator/ligand-binding sensor domain-containing protein
MADRPLIEDSPYLYQHFLSLLINYMFRPVYIFSLFCLLVFYSLPGNTNSKWIPINLSNEEGLSNSAITCILQDSEGVMWFGSWDGLNRYDGTNIKTFKPDYLEKSSLSNNIIRNLLEDKYHNLWVITNKDINRFLPNTMSFESYFSGNVYLPVREVNLKACIGPDSMLYVSLMRFGLSYYEQSGNIFRQLDLTGISEADHKNIIGLAGGRNNNLYLLGSEGKLFIYSKNKGFKKEYEEDLGNLRELIFERNWFIRGDQTTFLAISIESGGVFIMNMETHEVKRFSEGIGQLNVTTMNESGTANEFWLGTDDGSVYKLGLNNVPELTRMNENMPDLSSNKVKIWTIRQTSDDLLWIGTDGNGVYRYITKGKPFFNMKKGSSESGSLSHNIVRSVYNDKGGNLWVGTRGGGLNKLPPGSASRITYNMDNGLSNNAVLSLNMDKTNNLWIGVDGEGIDMLEQSSGKIFHFPGDLKNEESLEFGYVYTICVDVYGSIWLGTNGYGLVNMEVARDGKGGYILRKFRQFRYKQGEKGLNSDIVYSIVEEGPNVLWVGTRGGGLNRLNTLNYSFEIFGVRENSEKEFIDDDILSLCMSSNQKLWIGTSEGLSVLNLSYKPYQFVHYTERNGMPNNTVHGILEDAEGEIWISTNQGLSKLDVSRGVFLNFNKRDGLQNSEYTDGAYFKNPISNILYFGGVDGLDWFNPQEIELSDNFPPIILNEFRLNNSLVMPGDSTRILQSSLNNSSEIVLKHNQNFFSISFTSLNYYNSHKCQFYYILEGFSKSWVEAGEQRIAGFTNVPPGKYILKIKATNEDGIYGAEIRDLSVIIHQPYWNTFAAYIVYIALIGIFIYLLMRFLRQRTLQRRQDETDKLERAKSDEINQYKLQFFTDIAHEFRTPLTLIVAPAALLEEKLADKRRLGLYARSIFQNASKLQKLISELIEFRKVETRNMKLSFQPYDLVNYISKLVKAFEVYDKISDVKLTFSHPKEPLIAWIDPDKFERIVLNLLSNAIKYTPPGGSVEIELIEEELNFQLIVRDTGIGIPPELLDKIFDRFYHHGSSSHDSIVLQESGGVGLSLTRGLIELHHGAISVRNLPGGGSEFSVTMPRIQQGYEMHDAENIQSPSSEKIALNVEVEFPVMKLNDIKDDYTDRSEDNRQYSVLVVDDNYEVCSLVESMLIDTYFIFKAYDGKSALDILNKESIDLVISDVVMQGMDGIELTKRIKSDINTSHIPLIMLTAKAEIEDRIEGLEVGADSYIPKPFHPRHLMIRVEKLISSREQFRKTFRELEENISYSELLKGLTPNDQKIIRSLVEYIDENLQIPDLNANSLAHHVAMSKTQLYRKIKALTGLTPHGLINNLRLKRAAKTLKISQKTVSEVYYETGFNSRSYFYQTFKDAYGVPPGDYKDGNSD